MTVAEQIHKLAIVPVVVLDDKKDALPLAKALCEGGTAVRGGDIPYEGCERCNPYYDNGISGYGCRSRNGSYNRTG